MPRAQSDGDRNNTVVPAKAGTQWRSREETLGPRLRGDDGVHFRIHRALTVSRSVSW